MYGPEKVDDTLPKYPGFERDVFKVVKDYFCGLSEPLMTYEMYEVIINVYVKAQGIYYHNSQQNVNENTSSPKSLSSFQSVENLLLDLTNIGSTPESHPPKLGRLSSTSTLDLSPIPLVANSFSHTGLRRCESIAALPVARYETAFGPENRTVTRVYYRDGVSTDFGYTNGPKNLSRTPLETHFELSSTSNEHIFASVTDQTYDIYFARVRSMREKKSEKMHKEDKKPRRKSYGYSTAVAKSCDEDQNSVLENGDYLLRDSKNVKNYNDTYRTLPNRASNSHFLSGGVQYQNGPYQPVLQNTQLSKCKYYTRSSSTLHKVKSSSSLYNRNNNLQYQDTQSSRDNLSQGRTKSSTSLHKVQSSSSLYSAGNHFSRKTIPQQNIRHAESQESCNGRSLSMSDLIHRDNVESESPAVELFIYSRSPAILNFMLYIDLHEKNRDDYKEKTKKSLQLICLLLPPANRRKLHLLLKLMNKMAVNKELNLDDTTTVRALLLETFYRSILCSQDESDMEDVMVMMIVSFLMDHHADIMAVPTDLKSEVEDRVSNVSKTQMIDRDNLSASTFTTFQIVYSLDDPSSLNYCQQVSHTQYENNRLSNSQMALVNLLDEIIADTTMTAKNKKKRLKQ
ncbi:hypothetical protein KUTeg_016503, partial [Tegillarca granosa]